jgi:mannose-6-phosphate isomerase-like protein (cupin superfamily)
LGPGEGRRFWTALSDGVVKLESGAGDFSVFESSPPPDGSGPPPHLHRSYDEAWLVLAGVVDFRLAGQSKRVGAGSFVYAPRGTPHTFSNPGPGEARILVIGSAPVQAMVEEVGGLSENGPPDPSSIMAVFSRHDSELHSGST